MEKKMSRDEYRAKQKKYKEMAKSSGKWLHISKLPVTEVLGKPKYEQNSLIKGRTYRKPVTEDVVN